MKTIILKWNPSFSSYTLTRFLKAIERANDMDSDGRESNWSIWDHDKIGPGDRFYMLKVGYGQTGIVGKGIVTSEPYLGEDWSWNDRPRYYIDYRMDIMINPDAFELLTSDRLAALIPDFEWHGGHSGIVLSDSDAELLERAWDKYVAEQQERFRRASDDNLFIAYPEEVTDDPYSITLTRHYDDDISLEIAYDMPYFGSTLRKEVTVYDVRRLMHVLKLASRRLLIERLRTDYPDGDSLSQFCAFLYESNINFRTSVRSIDPKEEDDEL